MCMCVLPLLQCYLPGPIADPLHVPLCSCVPCALLQPHSTCALLHSCPMPCCSAYAPVHERPALPAGGGVPPQDDPPHAPRQPRSRLQRIAPAPAPLPARAAGAPHRRVRCPAGKEPPPALGTGTAAAPPLCARPRPREARAADSSLLGVFSSISLALSVSRLWGGAPPPPVTCSQPHPPFKGGITLFFLFLVGGSAAAKPTHVCQRGAEGHFVGLWCDPVLPLGEANAR